MRKPPTDVQQQLVHRYRHGRDGGYIIVTHEMGKNFQQLCKVVARPCMAPREYQGMLANATLFCRRRRAIMSAGPQKKKQKAAEEGGGTTKGKPRLLV